MLTFDKATYLLLFFRFILPVKLDNGPWGSDVSLLGTSFFRYKDHIVSLTSFIKFSDILHVFTCWVLSAIFEAFA